MDVRKGEFLSQSSAQSLKLQYWGHKFEACCGGSDVVDVESEWYHPATRRVYGTIDRIADFSFFDLYSFFTVAAGVPSTAPALVPTVCWSVQKLTVKKRCLMAPALSLKSKQAARWKLQNRAATSVNGSLLSTGFRATLLGYPLSL